MSIHIESSIKKDLTRAAGSKLDTILGSLKGNDILLLLSGGSSLALLDEISSENLAPSVTVSVLDERYSNDPSINNCAQIMTTNFFEIARRSGSKIIDTRVTKGESQDLLAKRFNEELSTWDSEHQNGKIVATIGMGPDGHVSGIMPFSEDPELFARLFESQDLVVGYDAGDKNPYPLRVTTTMKMLRRIDIAVGYISGENKRNAWNRVNSAKGSLNETPAKILHEMKGEVFVFTDLE